jgi:hypothetical protein
LNLPQNDHNSGKNGSKRIFLPTSPLFTPQRRSPSASRVPPHAHMELKGGKSSEHKCSAQNALPVGQPQEVIRGTARNRSRGWRGAARRVVTTLLRMCCFPSCLNKCHRGGQEEDSGEQGDLTTALGGGSPPRHGRKQQQVEGLGRSSASRCPASTRIHIHWRQVHPAKVSTPPGENSRDRKR